MEGLGRRERSEREGRRWNSEREQGEGRGSGNVRGRSREEEEGEWRRERKNKETGKREEGIVKEQREWQ